MFHSVDGEWAVEEIILNGHRRFRVTARNVRRASLTGDGRRVGPMRTPTGWWVADVVSPTEVERWVALADLVES